VLQMCYDRSMSMVASRELRNDTAGVLRRVQAGEDVTITVNGQPVAVIAAIQPKRRRWLTKGELVKRLESSQADAGLREDLAELAGEMTDDLDDL
jgi:prevent-host-death family protein